MKPIGNVSTMDVSHFIYENDPDRHSFDYMFTKSDRLSEIKKALHIPSCLHFDKTNSTVASKIEDRENNAAQVYTELL